MKRSFAAITVLMAVLLGAQSGSAAGAGGVRGVYGTFLDGGGRTLAVYGTTGVGSHYWIFDGCSLQDQGPASVLVNANLSAASLSAATTYGQLDMNWSGATSDLGGVRQCAGASGVTVLGGTALGESWVLGLNSGSAPGLVGAAAGTF